MSKCIGCQELIFDEINQVNFCNAENGCIFESKPERATIVKEIYCIEHKCKNYDLEKNECKILFLNPILNIQFKMKPNDLKKLKGCGYIDL
jgi:hypothetical protein